MHNYLATLAVGQGFEYHCKDAGAEAAIFKNGLNSATITRSRNESFIEYFVQGEEFIRIFGDDFRVIDPDYIYSTSDKKDGMADRYQGILSSTWDNNDILAYEVHESPVFGGTGDLERVPA